MIKPILKAKIVGRLPGATYKGRTYDQTIFFELSNGVVINLFDSMMIVKENMFNKIKNITASVFLSTIKKLDEPKYEIKLDTNSKTTLSGSGYKICGRIEEITKKHPRFIVDIGVGKIDVTPDDGVFKKFNVGDFLEIDTHRFDLEDIQ